MMRSLMGRDELRHVSGLAVRKNMNAQKNTDASHSYWRVSQLFQAHRFHALMSDCYTNHSVTLTSCHQSNKAQSNLTACFSALSHPSPQISTLKAVTWHYCYCVLLIPASLSLSLFQLFLPHTGSPFPDSLPPPLSILTDSISCGLSWVTWLILFTGHMALSQQVRGRKNTHTKKRILGVSLISWYQPALPPHHPRQHHCLSLVMWRERLGERFLQPHYSVIL